MLSGYLTNATRRGLLAGAALLTGGPGRASADAPTAAGPAVNPDARVIAACAAFNDVERRKLDLIEGPGRIEDDEARDRRLEPLVGEQLVQLDAVCEARATTLAGHRARAISVALWDGGEIAYRARVGGFLEDRLLAALVRDLAGLDALTPTQPKDGRSPGERDAS